MTRCAGALFPNGAKTQKAGANRSTPNARPWIAYQSSATYRRRRCIVPFDGFFEWKAIKGKKNKAIAMNDGRPFGIGGLWEN